MAIRIACVAVIAIAGWAFARYRPGVNLVILVFTLFAAVTAHSAMQWAFLEGRMDVVTGDPRRDAPAIAVVWIAVVEAAGLWVPFLILPWARFVSRVAASAYALAASVLAAVYHYFPFDLVLISPEIIDPFRPPYLFAWFLCLPLAALGALAGWLQASRERANADLDWPDPPGA